MTTAAVLKYFNLQSPFVAEVVSRSMEPTYQKRDLVTIQPCTIDSVKIHDVIAFLQPNNPDTIVIHRIIGKHPLGYLTKGDANLTPDTWQVTDAQLIGKVIGIRRSTTSRVNRLLSRLWRIRQ